MKLDLNFNFMDNNNKPMEIQLSNGIVEKLPVASKYVGTQLCNGNNPEHSCKLADMGETLYKKGEIEIDSTDLKLFEEEIKKHNLSKQMRKQILEAIEKEKLLQCSEPK